MASRLGGCAWRGVDWALKAEDEGGLNQDDVGKDEGVGYDKDLGRQNEEI